MSELPDFDNDRSGFRAYVHKELRRAYDIGGMWALDEAWRLLGTWLGPSCAAIVLRHRAGETVYEDRTIISFATDYWPLTVLEGRARKARGLATTYSRPSVGRTVPGSKACSMPPPARRQGRLVLPNGALHPGGEEQGADRHPALQAGIHLAGRLDPVRQLTGAIEGGREDDLTGEQTV